MIEALCIDGPLEGTNQQAGPRGLIGFSVVYPHRRIFETGRYDLRVDPPGRPWLTWREFPMSIDEAVIIHDEWAERDRWRR